MGLGINVWAKKIQYVYVSCMYGVCVWEREREGKQADVDNVNNLNLSEEHNSLCYFLNYSTGLNFPTQ